MGGRTWQPHERALFEEHVDDDDWLPTLKAAFPDRTDQALRTAMSKLRVSLGFSDGREIDAGWMQNAREASPMLRDATLRVGMWS